MGIKVTPDVFHNVMFKLVQDMEYVRTHLDDLLILVKSFKDHQPKLEMVLARISIPSMRVNASKSKFFKKQIEHLDYWIIDKVFNKCIKRLKLFLRLRLISQKKTIPVFWCSYLLLQHVVPQK